MWATICLPKPKQLVIIFFHSHTSQDINNWITSCFIILSFRFKSIYCILTLLFNCLYLSMIGAIPPLPIRGICSSAGLTLLTKHKCSTSLTLRPATDLGHNEIWMLFCKSVRGLREMRSVYKASGYRSAGSSLIFPHLWKRQVKLCVPKDNIMPRPWCGFHFKLQIPSAYHQHFTTILSSRATQRNTVHWAVPSGMWIITVMASQSTE